MVNIDMDLWVEKYRPKQIEDYVFKNEEMKQQILEWINNPRKKNIPFPHLLLSGVAGSGKTSLAQLLLLQLNVDENDIQYINASKDNSIEDVRHKIANFISRVPIGRYKVVFLDEADNLSPGAQKALRSDIEMYSTTARFILTANYPNKIIPALHSRLQKFHFDALDMEEFIQRLATILEKEKIQYDPEILLNIINKCYPDLRQCINMIDQYSRNGVLHPPDDNHTSGFDWIDAVIPLFKAKKYTEARELICSQMTNETYEDVWTFMYKHLDLWSDTDEGKSQAIMIINNGYKGQSLVADKEINLAATLVELCSLDV